MRLITFLLMAGKIILLLAILVYKLIILSVAYVLILVGLIGLLKNASQLTGELFVNTNILLSCCVMGIGFVLFTLSGHDNLEDVLKKTDNE